MADESTSAQEAKTEIPEHQAEPEAPETADEEDGQIFDFRKLGDEQEPMPEVSGAEGKKKDDKKSAASTGETVKEPTDKKAQAEPEWKSTLSKLEQSNAVLQSQVANLNAALHQERQAKKTEKQEEQPLTQAQMDELFKLHADDPVELRKLVEYTAAQAARRGKEDTLNSIQVAEQRKNAEAKVRERWGTLLDDPEKGPQVRSAIEGTKRMLGVENHPMAEYLAMSALVHENYQAMIKAEYERGKAEAIGTVAEEGRKKTVKETGLERGEKSIKGGDGVVDFKAKHSETIKALGMSPGQIKTYERMMKAKGARMIEASR